MQPEMLACRSPYALFTSWIQTEWEAIPTLESQQKHPYLWNSNFQTCEILNKENNTEIVTFFKHAFRIVPCGSKSAVRRTSRKNRLLHGDNTGGGTVMLQPFSFRRVRVWIPTGLPCTHIHSWPHVHSNSDLRKIQLAPYLPERNYIVSWGMSVVLTAERGRERERERERQRERERLVLQRKDGFI